MFEFGPTSGTNKVVMEVERNCFLRDLDAFIGLKSSENGSKRPPHGGGEESEIQRIRVQRTTDGYRTTLTVPQWIFNTMGGGLRGWGGGGGGGINNFQSPSSPSFWDSFSEQFPDLLMERTSSVTVRPGHVAYHVHTSFDYLTEKYSIKNILGDALWGQKKRWRNYALMSTYALAMWLCTIIQVINKPEKYEEFSSSFPSFYS